MPWVVVGRRRTRAKRPRRSRGRARESLPEARSRPCPHAPPPHDICISEGEKVVYIAASDTNEGGMRPSDRRDGEAAREVPFATTEERAGLGTGRGRGSDEDGTAGRGRVGDEVADHRVVLAMRLRRQRHALVAQAARPSASGTGTAVSRREETDSKSWQMVHRKRGPRTGWKHPSQVTPGWATFHSDSCGAGRQSEEVN